MKAQYKNRFSIGFTDEQFQWMEDKRISLIQEAGKWISRADFLRSLVNFPVTPEAENEV